MKGNRLGKLLVLFEKKIKISTNLYLTKEKAR